MTARILHNQQNMEEKHIRRQMGCIAGFLQIFDRHQFLDGKQRATKRLAPSLATESTSESEKSEESPVAANEQPQIENLEVQQNSPEIATAKPPFPSPCCEFKEDFKSPWKFRESPRLSLDSRATMDGKGSFYPREIRTKVTEEESDKQRCSSPSVVARLMGLEALPESTTREPLKKPELRRSASESKSRDLNRFAEGQSFHQKQLNAEAQRLETKGPIQMEFPMKKSKSDQSFSTSPWKSQQQGKSYFDSQDFFPEPKQTSCLFGELEKRLKMRGITEPAEDLETLKQILEALQLKGLLHSRRRVERISNHNFIFEENIPIAVRKPSKAPVSRRIGNQSPPSNPRSKNGIRRNINASGEGETLPPVRRRIDRSERRLSNSMSPDRIESNARSPCSPARKKPLTAETERRRNDSVDQRRSSPLNSPSRSPRNNRRSTAKISSKERISYPIKDESSSVSESTISTISQFDVKGLKTEMVATDSQPSPVSVLDSSFYKDDEFSPLKSSIDQSIELEEDNWRQAISPIRLKSNDADFVYVSKILEASKCISEESDLFLLLEKQSYKLNACNVSRLHRKLVFDTITEIVDKKKQLPPWKAVSSTDSTKGKPSFRQIWLEYSRIRERPKAEDFLEVICGALKKDLADETVNGWGDCPMETSDVVLHIERLIFKDLVEDTIQNLPTFIGKSRGFMPKKLVF